MKWEEVKLSDICVSIYDGTHQAPPKTEAGVPFITISNVDKSNKIDFTDTAFVSKEYYDSIDGKRKARKGDILYTVVGSFGIPVYVKEDTEFVFQRHIAILRPHNKIDGKFLYYTMLSRDFYMQADSVALGAAQRTITLNSLRNMTIKLPSFEVQQRIASILSAYDDLIENNQKQIKLLEEAAQRLYKEWFVNLHFPGHEDVEIVDGVPKGWSIKRLDEVYSIKYGKNLSTNDINDYGKYPVYGANGVIGYYDKCNCEQQVVLITSRGNGSGDVLKTCHRKSFVTNNSFVVNPMTEYKHCEMAFTYQLLKTVDFRAIRTGSAQPQLTNQVISTVVVNLPSRELIIDYCNKVTVMEDTILKLKKEIMLLEEVRDRLLPKLMSGEVEV